jgi:hypothetical protein
MGAPSIYICTNRVHMSTNNTAAGMQKYLLLAIAGCRVIFRLKLLQLVIVGF